MRRRRTRSSGAAPRPKRAQRLGRRRWATPCAAAALYAAHTSMSPGGRARGRISTGMAQKGSARQRRACAVLGLRTPAAAAGDTERARCSTASDGALERSRAAAALDALTGGDARAGTRLGDAPRSGAAGATAAASEPDHVVRRCAALRRVPCAAAAAGQGCSAQTLKSPSRNSCAARTFSTESAASSAGEAARAPEPRAAGLPKALCALRCSARFTFPPR